MTIRIVYEATQGGADAALAKSLTKSYPYVWNVQVGICDVFACDFVIKILLNVSETGMSTTINLPDLDSKFHVNRRSIPAPRSYVQYIKIFYRHF
jgi:hypothetical protein